MSTRWSKLQKRLYLVIDPKIDFQLHCSIYRMKSQLGRTDLPRYWITIGKEIIFDYPRQFMDRFVTLSLGSDTIKLSMDAAYPYITDIRALSDLIQEYLDTPKDDILERNFEDDLWGLTDILKVSDRRIGTRRLASLMDKNEVTDRIIKLRMDIEGREIA